MGDALADFAALEDLLPPQRASVHNERLDFCFGGHVNVSLLVDAMPGCGGIAWPAGEVLAHYISSKYTSLAGQCVLELGAGTGLVGLAAGKLGAHVVITDQKPLLQTMRTNVTLNELSETVSVAELNWGETITDPILEPTNFSMVLVADCVYFEPAFPLLVSTLDTLASRSNAQFFFCYKRRRKADKHFFALLKKCFTWEEVSDDPKQTEYKKEGISLLRLERKKNQPQP